VPFMRATLAGILTRSPSTLRFSDAEPFVWTAPLEVAPFGLRFVGRGTAGIARGVGRPEPPMDDRIDVRN